MSGRRCAAVLAAQRVQEPALQAECAILAGCERRRWRGVVEGAPDDQLPGHSPGRTCVCSAAGRIGKLFEMNVGAAAAF